MRKLNRGPAPACLSNYSHGQHNWRQVTKNDKESIWQELEAMQGQRCAYCEGQANPDSRHIEHFEQKHGRSQVTFLWSNLFGSCNRNDSCGSHKDRQQYTSADIIKPDAENPEAFFLFVGETGKITVREGLSDADQHRARETIRIFNLNGPLAQIRKARLVQYVPEGLEARRWFETGLATVEQIADFFKDEISATADSPYATAIRHTLLPYR